MLYVPTGVAAAAVCGKGCAATAVCPKGVVAALTDGTQDSMYIPVPQDEPYYFPCMDGTHDSMQGLAQYKWRTILEVHPILDQEWSTI
ncbi:uncharacterized protein LOC114257030 isoform X6 [Camellia sinensis]|uniref:uncharacterized protein LOC114257030 isoform X6 n=1 Tax=Camellia sinensis TaxID=4442 RepID=UPI0010359772|nr:uncharacterized protein LOC114257030 isoform X6 [Camellia sinensis]